MDAAVKRRYFYSEKKKFVILEWIRQCNWKSYIVCVTYDRLAIPLAQQWKKFSSLPKPTSRELRLKQWNDHIGPQINHWNAEMVNLIYA